MKKRDDGPDEMPAEVDFSKAMRRGQFHHQFMTERIEAIRRDWQLERELIALRKARGFTPQGLAERIGVPLAAIAQLEAGGTSESLDLALVLRYVAGLGGKLRFKIVAETIPGVQRRTRKTA